MEFSQAISPERFMKTCNLKNMISSRLIGLILILIQSPLVSAGVQLPAIFGDHMVLQGGQAIPIWGMAAPGEMISVSLGEETVKTVAQATGRWSVSLAAREPGSKPVKLIIKGTNQITLEDILIGEVWLCSGQSNMHWPVKLAVDGPAQAEQVQGANLRILNLQGRPYPNGREFTDEELQNLVPEKYLSGQWARATPSNLMDFSAVAFFFGRELLQKRNVPIGLIHNAIGGTPTEAWISPDALKTNPRLNPLMEPNWLEQKRIHSFCRDRAALNLQRLKPENPDKTPSIQHPYQPGFMYSSGIAPIAPFAIRGVLWYQGESNAHDPALHDELFKTLVADWRKAWSQGDFPFYFVQLPNFDKAQGWAEFRESQRRGLSIANTAMAVTIDLGDPADVHPNDKREVAHRLALIARARIYGEPVEYSGPVIQSIRRENRRLRLKFGHAKGGLKTIDQAAVTGFEIAGKENAFMPASARIEGDEIVLENHDINEPTGARYGFAQNPKCNLTNESKLLASPFVEFIK